MTAAGTWARSDEGRGRASRLRKRARSGNSTPAMSPSCVTPSWLSFSRDDLAKLNEIDVVMGRIRDDVQATAFLYRGVFRAEAHPPLT
jgi:hypothetical protein